MRDILIFIFKCLINKHVMYYKGPFSIISITKCYNTMIFSLFLI